MTGAALPSPLRGGWPAAGWPGGVVEAVLDVFLYVPRVRSYPTRLAALGSLPSRGREGSRS
jgi:hypothetical protein